MMSSSDVDLLLVGKTGNGKSAAGNAILKRKSFKSSGAFSSVTKKIDYEVSDFNGRIIKVVDGPGVGDTRMNTDAGVKLVMVSMEKAIATNPKGYHAFLLAVKYGQRFTGEEQDTIVFLKKIFGETFVKEFCILIMTNGDTFQSESEETGQTFEDWCKSQTGAFKTLLEECGHRVVLFNNITKDEDIRNKQVRQLLSVVDQLSSKGQRYTDVNFAEARETRKKVMVEAQEPLIRDETMQETSLIFQKLEQIQACANVQTKLDLLEKLIIRAEALLTSIQNLDRETGALHEILQTVRSLKSTISDEIKYTIRSQEEIRRIKEVEDGLKRKFDEENEKLRQQFEQMMVKERLEGKRKEEVLRQQEKERAELEKKMNQERKDIEREHKIKLEQERLDQIRRIEELDKQYRKTKEKNDETILGKVVSGITWPFRKVAGWFS